MSSQPSLPPIAPVEESVSSPIQRVEHLTSGRLLAANILWNMVGLGAPAITGVFCLPLLKPFLGTDRLGLITLAWAIIGYFSLFWLLRVTLDAVLFFVLSHRLLPESKIITGKLPAMLAAALTTFVAAETAASLGVRIVVVCGSTVLAGATAWFRMFAARERKSLQSLLQWRGALSCSVSLYSSR